MGDVADFKPKTADQWRELGRIEPGCIPQPHESVSATS